MKLNKSLATIGDDINIEEIISTQECSIQKRRN